LRIAYFLNKKVCTFIKDTVIEKGASIEAPFCSAKLIKNLK